MNCEEYLAMGGQERFILIGQVVHLLQNNPDAFAAMSSMVRSAAQQGEFDNVTIFPNSLPEVS